MSSAPFITIHLLLFITGKKIPKAQTAGLYGVILLFTATLQAKTFFFTYGYSLF